MRILAMVSLFAGLAAAQDLRPRGAAGWEGFGKSSKVKLQIANAHKGQVPRVTIIEGTLTAVGKQTLTVAWRNRNIAIARSQKQVLRRKGHAQPGEKATVGKPVNETVNVGKRKVACVKLRTVVTGPAGKRVITEWTAKKPRVIVRHVVMQYDKSGAPTQTETIHLTKLNVKRDVNGKPVVCRQYKVTRKYPDGATEKGEAYFSRSVPGGTVFIETLKTGGKQPARTQRITCMDFAVK